jgi:hypothetical protein
MCWPFKRNIKANSPSICNDILGNCEGNKGKGKDRVSRSLTGLCGPRVMGVQLIGDAETASVQRME